MGIPRFHLLLIAVSILLGAGPHLLAKDLKPRNGCCSYPCNNRGTCMDEGEGHFTCDCTRTGYYGRTCRIATWSTYLHNLVHPTPETVNYFVSNYQWFWMAINEIYFLRCAIMKFVLRVRTDIISIPPVYLGNYDYPIAENIYNLSYHARTLPPIPENCPTPMGVKGPKVLPPVSELAEKLFKRKKFKPCSLRTNVLFASYAQHFTHMFLKLDHAKGPEFTWGHHGIDMTNVYGNDKGIENKLRSFQDGKLKSQVIHGEEYPPFAKDVGISMLNPKRDKRVFAIGHPFFATLPHLVVYSIIHMREHNRVVAILKKAHRNWSDERLFQTGKLILLGSTIKIVVEDYVQHLSNYQFRLIYDPSILHDQQLQYQNRIHLEFHQLYHWHPLMPDSIQMPLSSAAGSAWVEEEKDEVLGEETRGECRGCRRHSFMEWMFNGTEPVLAYGTRAIVKALVRTPAGVIGARNHGETTISVVTGLMTSSRALRMQPFNEYRKRFNLKPYTSFIRLTGGDTDLAATLKSLYQHIDAVELYVGLLVEHRQKRGIFGQTMIEMGSPYSLQGLFGNFLSSPALWRPSTFGGKVGFDIVRTANLRDMFCNNLPAPCPRISFKTSGENWDTVLETKGEVDAGMANHIDEESTANNLSKMDKSAANTADNNRYKSDQVAASGVDHYRSKTKDREVESCSEQQEDCQSDQGRN